MRRTKDGFFLSQSAYAQELLERAGMANCNTIATPADTKPKASVAEGKLLVNATTYRGIANALQYLTIT